MTMTLDTPTRSRSAQMERYRELVAAKVAADSHYDDGEPFTADEAGELAMLCTSLGFGDAEHRQHVVNCRELSMFLQMQRDVEDAKAAIPAAAEKYNEILRRQFNEFPRTREEIAGRERERSMAKAELDTLRQKAASSNTFSVRLSHAIDEHYFERREAVRGELAKLLDEAERLVEVARDKTIVVTDDSDRRRNKVLDRSHYESLAKFGDDAERVKATRRLSEIGAAQSRLAEIRERVEPLQAELSGLESDAIRPEWFRLDPPPF